MDKLEMNMHDDFRPLRIAYRRYHRTRAYTYRCEWRRGDRRPRQTIAAEKDNDVQMLLLPAPKHEYRYL